ncbi:MAG: SMP-30/gluconolactonase/LRE family protein [Sandaracinus sp.]|nr:SMP-30/gluconolactonase/LRE family protein [Sandaracinus sp.]
MPRILACCLLFLAACGDDDAPLEDAGRDSSVVGVDASFDAATNDDAGTAADASTDAFVGVDAGPPPVCPPGSESLVLELGGVSLSRVEGVPILDGFADGWSIVEGPVFFDGGLLVSHFQGGNTPASRVYRVTSSGVTVAFSNAGTNGLALGPDGMLYGASHVMGAIVRFDPSRPDAAPTPVVTGYEGARFNTPNDLVFRSDGQIYLSDPDYQAPASRPQAAERAYHVDLEGVVRVIEGAPSKPNGVALSLDERTLFVAGSNGLRRFDLAENGAVSSGPTNVDAVSGGLDGIGRDCAGNLYLTGGGQVVVLDRELRRVGALSAPGATNVAFGGDDRRTIYVTTLGDSRGLYAARLNVPGLPD